MIAAEYGVRRVVTMWNVASTPQQSGAIGNRYFCWTRRWSGGIKAVVV
jgi:hypothetical protein